MAVESVLNNLIARLVVALIQMDGPVRAPSAAPEPNASMTVELTKKPPLIRPCGFMRLSVQEPVMIP